MAAGNRLTRAFRDAPVLPLTPADRYVLISDCHRGTGLAGDNFLKNQHLYFAALSSYFDQGYTYIELGDGDELWENRSFEAIKQIHNNTFWLLSRFYNAGRLYMLYGNHDMVKRSPRFVTCSCTSYPCSACGEQELFPGIRFLESLILRRQDGRHDLYLTHGHQADFLNSVLWRPSRFLVRYIWKPLEQRGFLDPTSAAKNNTRKKLIEERLSRWAYANDCILITGHTHRPMLEKGSSYYNTGSCIHPRCITAIEIRDLQAVLVKWTVRTRKDFTLYVAREILSGPVFLE